MKKVIDFWADKNKRTWIFRLAICYLIACFVMPSLAYFVFFIFKDLFAAQGVMILVSAVYFLLTFKWLESK